MWDEGHVVLSRSSCLTINALVGGAKQTFRERISELDNKVSL